MKDLVILNLKYNASLKPIPSGLNELFSEEWTDSKDHMGQRTPRKQEQLDSTELTNVRTHRGLGSIHGAYTSLSQMFSQG